MRFYFYDLETSGVNPRWDRIMQFAGQATDMKLRPVGEPDNILIKLTEDVLPQPDAVLTHGISPQKARAEGVTEAEFLRHFTEKVALPGTIFVGFNNIRFDDEFMRFTFWRNFYDAYEWQWKDGCGRWDLLDLARMTRALRPEGIKWPFAPNGKPTVRLELLAAINKLEHVNAHDALSDVKASIAIARLIYLKQPRLFNYLLNLRDKKKVAELVTTGNPVVYTSGKYPSEYHKTTVAVMVGPSAAKPGAIMYDLRIDPDKFIKMEPAKLAKKWLDRSEKAQYFPLKVLAYNRSPAIAPFSVLDGKSALRLNISIEEIEKNLKKIKKAKNFIDRLNAAEEIIATKYQPELLTDEYTVDSRLYDGFIGKSDQTKMSVVRAADEQDLTNLNLDFEDERLKLLLPLYKARNFPSSLNEEEKTAWEKFRLYRLTHGGDNSRAGKFFKRLDELKKRSSLSPEQAELIREIEAHAKQILLSV